MTRFFTSALVAAPTLFAGVASAHPGHGTPHVLHDVDFALGWWVFAVAAAGVGLALRLGKRRS